MEQEVPIHAWLKVGLIKYDGVCSLNKGKLQLSFESNYNCVPHQGSQKQDFILWSNLSVKETVMSMAVIVSWTTAYGTASLNVGAHFECPRSITFGMTKPIVSRMSTSARSRFRCQATPFSWHHFDRETTFTYCLFSNQNNCNRKNCSANLHLIPLIDCLTLPPRCDFLPHSCHCLERDFLA
jgi:hypothetical protein